MRHKWGSAGPPPDAYSRVTDPGRFAPLHGVAAARLEQLRMRYHVDCVEGSALDDVVVGIDLARPSMKLVPIEPISSPLLVAFTQFPGLIVRCGWFVEERFPACGCDACGETAEDEAQRLREMINAVVGGRFREGIRVPLWGDAWHEWELGTSPSRRGGGSRIERSRLQQHGKPRTRTFDWAAWSF